MPHDAVHGRPDLWHAADLSIERSCAWGGISASVFRRGGAETVWLNGRHRLLLVLESGDPATICFEGGRTLTGPYAPGLVGFYPAGRTARIQHSAGPMRFVQVLQDPATYEAVARELAGQAAFDPEPLVPIEDPLVSGLIQALAHEIEDGPASRLLAESLSMALAARLLRRFAAAAPRPAPAGGLAPGRLRRVLDHIEARLDEEMTLAELAEVACLSPWHFSRCFKQATGMGLRRYVLGRRIERAKALLRRRGMSLAAVAQLAGFADQSHFTAVFRRETGTTPGRFRAGLA